MRKPSTALITSLLLAVFFGISLFLRAYLPRNEIFVNDWVKFSSHDAYFYMRIVDNLAHNFPHLNYFDPYMIYPDGAWVGSIMFFARLIAGVAWLIGLGSPSQHLVDVVGAYFPPIMAALTVIPVYFIGKNLFSRGAGILAAGLIAILPGEFMGRSILGFTDHHVAETLFTTVLMLFLVLAVKSGRQAGLTFSHLKDRDRAASRRTVIYALIAGVSLGIYLITWIGGLLFIFIITAYFIAQFIIDHLKGKPTGYLGIIGVVLFVTATAVFIPFSPGMFYLASLVIAVVIPLVLSGISLLMASRQLKPAYYPMAVIGATVAGLGIFRVANPSLLSSMLEQFSIFVPSGPHITTLEMQPLSPQLAWSIFTTAFFLGIAAWLILVYSAARRGNPEMTLLLVWSLVVFAATLGQRRFAYYLVVNVALLTGYLSWQFIWLARLKTVVSERSAAWARPGEGGLARRGGKNTERKRAKAARGRGSQGITVNRVKFALVATMVFFLVFFPNFAPAVNTASQARFAPSDAWYSALVWLKENSPDPFGNPDFYYQLYETPKPMQPRHPESAYGVTAWWDYGYWIMRIAHRLPTANPSQDPQAIANTTRLFLSQDEASAQGAAQKLGTRYLMIDNETVTSKFWAVVTWSGKPMTDFFAEYYYPPQKVFVRLYYPGYYRSLSTRLYNFDTRAVTPKSTIVIAWEEKWNREGGAYREITSAQTFEDYRDAVAHIQVQKSGNYRIVGDNPFLSPVPLEALKDYRLVYASTIAIGQPEVGPVPAVKIFEYTGGRAGPAQK